MLAVFVEGGGLRKTDDDSFVKRRSNFEGASLKALLEIQPPFVFYPGSLEVKASAEGWTDDGADAIKDITDAVSLTGPFYEMLRCLEARMNFTTRLWTRRDFNFGHRRPGNATTPTGGWSGMLGNLLRGEADLIVASVTQTTKRFQAVDFLLPMGTETPAFYMARQGYERKEWLSFLYPLRPQVWMLLFLNALLLMLALKMLQIYYYYYYNRKARNFSIPLFLMECFGDLWMLGASYFGRKPNLEQGTPEESSRPLRILLLVAFLSGNIVFMSYRASLTAELAVRRRTLPFDSLEELLDSDIRYLST